MHSTTPRRLHWFSYQPTPYNDFLFKNLGRAPNIDLLVHYRAKIVNSHPWSSPLGQDYACRYYDPICQVDWRSIELAFRQPRAFFMIAGWDHPTTVLLLNLLRLLRRQYAVWTDTPNLKKRRFVKEMARSSWLNWIFRGAECVLATGRPGIEAVLQMGAFQEKVAPFPFWVDLSRYRPNNLQSSEAPIRFMSSGRLVNRLKGHDLAIKAIARAMEESELDWEYVIAGTGSDAENLSSLSKSLGVEKHIRFPGWVESDQLISLYHQSQILVHPSPMDDPFPNAVLEGMAAGCVVLASDVCGSAVDRIDSGVNGFLHRSGDWQELSDQVRALVSDRARLARMGQLARKTAEAWPIERGIELICSLVHPVRNKPCAE
jgi:glycosyltransferase involved in cell wall biosynthesis